MTTAKSTALVTSLSAQDGAHLAELLSEKAYAVHTTEGDRALLPVQPPRGGQDVCLLEQGELPRSLRHQRLQRSALQPREPAARRNLRYPQFIRTVACIALGLQDCPCLGNLSALTDWAHAGDYVEMQWPMLQQDETEHFEIATDVQYSVRQFIEFSAKVLGITLECSVTHAAEIGTVARVDMVEASTKHGARPAT